MNEKDVESKENINLRQTYCAFHLISSASSEKFRFVTHFREILILGKTIEYGSTADLDARLHSRPVVRVSAKKDKDSEKFSTRSEIIVLRNCN